MACVSTKDEVSWQEAGFSLDQKLWNTTNQDFIKFTASDFSREAEQIDRGFLVVSVSKGLSSQLALLPFTVSNHLLAPGYIQHRAPITHETTLEGTRSISSKPKNETKQTEEKIWKKERTNQTNNSSNNKTVGISDWKFGGE